MKRLPVLTLGLLLFAASSFAQTEAVAYPKWEELNLLDGDIRVTFPGGPSRSTVEREQPIGKVISTEFYLSFPKITFMLSWSDFPHSAVMSDDALKGSYDSVRDQVLAGMSAKLIAERDIRTDGVLGRELVFANEIQFVKYRIYIVGRREYQLITTRYADLEKDLKTNSEVDKFLDSFHFISQTADNKPE